MSYHKLGSSVPESINLPDYVFALNNGNLFELDYSFDRLFNKSYFSFSEKDSHSTLTWRLNIPEGADIKVPAIPSEITAKYPYLDRDELLLSYVRFTEYLDGYSYQDYVRSSPRTKTRQS